MRFIILAFSFAFSLSSFAGVLHGLSGKSIYLNEDLLKEKGQRKIKVQQDTWQCTVFLKRKAEMQLYKGEELRIFLEKSQRLYSSHYECHDTPNIPQGAGMHGPMGNYGEPAPCQNKGNEETTVENIVLVKFDHPVFKKMKCRAISTYTHMKGNYARPMTLNLLDELL